MTNKKNDVSEPENRFEFSNNWDEITYLYEKATYWIIYKKNYKEAGLYVPKLKNMVYAEDPNNEAIVGVECKAFVASYEDRLEDEISYNLLLIRLVTMFIESESGLVDYDAEYLLNSIEELALLYEENGQRDKALEAVRDCEVVSEKYSLPFNGKKLINQITSPKTGTPSTAKIGSKKK